MKEIIARNGHEEYVVATISNKEAKKYHVGDYFKTISTNENGIATVAMVEIVEVRGDNKEEKKARELASQKRTIEFKTRSLNRWFAEENRIYASKTMKETTKKKKIAECEEAINAIKNEIKMLRNK
jgi:hypothetical protein